MLCSGSQAGDKVWAAGENPPAHRVRVLAVLSSWGCAGAGPSPSAVGGGLGLRPSAFLLMWLPS